MAKVKIVLDTNVLYAGLYSADGASHQVLRQIERGAVKIALSTTLLFEYEEVLRRSQSDLGLSARDVEAVLDALCACGEHRRIYFLWRPQLPDPKDDHLLELAVAAGADAIVTRNQKHLSEAERFGIAVLSPRGLLEKIE